MSTRPGAGIRASLTLRLSLLFAAASTIVLLALGQFIARSVDRHFVELDLELAEGKLQLTATALAAIGAPIDLAAIDARLSALLIGHDDIALRVDGPDGQPWFANLAGAALDASRATAAAREGVAQTAPHVHGLPQPATRAADPGLLQWSHQGATFRGLARTLPTGLPGSPRATVAVGVDTGHHVHYLASLRQALWGFVAAAVLAMGLLGWAAARHGLAPLRRLGRAAERVTAGRLDRRLPVEELPTEMAALASQLNAMLARLEAAFERLSALSSDLAHELRTPVARLLTQVQVTLARPRDAADYRDALAASAEGLEQLSRTVADLLLLAKADNGLLPPPTGRVELASLAAQVIAYHEAPAAERQVSLRVEGESRVPGDAGLLARALSNLVSNAIRHAQAGSAVTVAIGPSPVSDGSAMARVCVRNHGDALSAETLERMFDRFWRADASRARGADEAGLGLGLALVRAIARAGGGDAGASHRDGVTAVWIDLPVGRETSGLA